ncbi:hypothetical protein BofuT4_uP057200.1 [Botrytis cinerea T4]|uniref:Uncharacterized protein n=1 Tax=Botryotinia fuckeliana (strain T4) TaxID=999810 RepID=G2XUH0_BOTF4|nr:hypothetical protein BofuT4_uP057200.1 [Botrytis cinerea T4]
MRTLPSPYLSFHNMDAGTKTKAMTMHHPQNPSQSGACRPTHAIA